MIESIDPVMEPIDQSIKSARDKGKEGSVSLDIASTLLPDGQMEDYARKIATTIVM